MKNENIKKWYVVKNNYTKWYNGNEFIENPSMALGYNNIKSATEVAKTLGGIVHVMTKNEIEF